jgi:ribosome modulation factor
VTAIADRWRRSAEVQQKARRTRWMAGWDAAIKGETRNPYTREDYRSNWASGFKTCMAGEPLPYWYPEWRAAQKGR